MAAALIHTQQIVELPKTAQQPNVVQTDALFAKLHGLHVKAQ